MKRYTVHGFTLVELIVVIAIIGILAGILVPSLIGYVNKAKRSADAASAKTLYNQVELIFTEDTLYDGFNGKRETPYQAFNTHNFKTIHTVKVGNESYDLHVVAKCAGCGPAQSQPFTNGFYHWNGNTEGTAIYAALEQSFMYSKQGKYQIRMQSSKYQGKKTDLWMICYREIKSGKDKNAKSDRVMEIWAGDSTGKWASLPQFRLYPNPSEGY